MFRKIDMSVFGKAIKFICDTLVFSYSDTGNNLLFFNPILKICDHYIDLYEYRIYASDLLDLFKDICSEIPESEATRTILKIREDYHQSDLCKKLKMKDDLISSPVSRFLFLLGQSIDEPWKHRTKEEIEEYTKNAISEYNKLSEKYPDTFPPIPKKYLKESKVNA